MADVPDTTNGSIARVALDLATRIFSQEHASGRPDQPRSYWLKLYAECAKTVANRSYDPS
jgi:hypothetical protein